MTEAVIYPCPHCGTANRLPSSDAGKIVCGRCKAAIFPAQPVSSNDAMFAQQVLQSPIPVLVDFWAPWCGPCRALAPALEQAAGTFAGQVLIVKVNVDENPQLSQQFQIRSIPTMVFFRHGKVVETMTGGLPAQALQHKIQAWLS